MTTLYLKYRPQKISDLDLTDVRDLLSKIVSSGNIPHAFLFEGPRGSGKTSAARIIAKVLNCEKLSKDFEPCNNCDQCKSITKGTNIDIVELDAASHRGIDDVRLIRESVKLAPAKAKKKVYIIDEAHMLTTEASNALLKTLEEPPDHVVFILATTNPEKLLDTIKSRTVRINFKKATHSEIFKSLENVLVSEKKKFQKEVLELISDSVDGSFRDAKKILEELIIKDAVGNLEIAQNYLMRKSDFDIESFIDLVKKKNLKECIVVLNNAENAGVSAKTVYSQLIQKIKSMLFSLAGYKTEGKLFFSKTELLNLSDMIIPYWNRYQNDISDYMPLYLFVTGWRVGEDAGGGEIQPEKEVETQKTIPETDKSRNVQDKNKDNSNGITQMTNGEVVQKSDAGKIYPETGDINISDEVWKRVLQTVREKNASTEALLRASKPASFDGKKLTLGVFYKFHKEKLESNPHKICLEDCLRGTVGSDIRVECFLTQPLEIPPKTTEASIVNNNSDTAENSKASTTGSVVLSETEDADLAKLAEEVFGN